MKAIQYATFLLLFLSACYPPKTQQDTEAEKHSHIAVRVNLVSEPSSLDPRKVRDLHSISLVKMLFEGLTHINAFEKPELALAESVTISQDLKTYTFKLKNTFWCNGDPVTAHDFVYSWKKVLDPNFPADNAFQLYVIKGAKAAKSGTASLDEIGVKAINDDVLEVQLENPTPYFLDLVAFPAFFPINKKIDVENPNWANSSQTMIGNGPFSLNVWEHQHLLSFQKNEKYWDAATVKLDEVHFAMVMNETELRMFEKKELDWAGSPFSTLPVDAIAHFQKNNQVNVKPFLATYFFRCNIVHPALSSVHLRKALALAINRKEIVEHVTQGGQRPITALVPSSMELQQSGYFSDGDLPVAQQHFQHFLAETGFTLETIPEITLIYSSGDRNHLLAQTVQQQWFKAFGLNVKLEAMETKVFFDRIRKKDYVLATCNWIADFNDPINFLEVFKYQSASTNNTGWEDKEYTRLLDASNLEMDESQRKNFLSMSEKILMDAMPIIPLFENNLLYMKNQKLKNIVITSMGVIDFKWAHMEKDL